MPTSPALPKLWTQLVDSVPHPCALFDLEMRYLHFNASWRKAFRVAPDMPQNASNRVPINDDRWDEAMTSALAGETTTCELAKIEHADSSVDHLRWRIAPWRDDDDAVCGVIAHVEVISAQVLAQRRISDQSEFERALFERSPVGMNLCRMDGTWLESNPAFLQIIGYPKEEADGKLTYWELTPRKYDDDEAVQLESLTSTGRYGPYEKEFIRKDGSLVPVQLNGFLIDRDGEQFIWSLIEDISSRKSLEAEIEQERSKTIQASKLAMLGEMAAGVAHEVNNPLSIIDGYLQVLSSRDDPGPLLQEGLEAMAGATRRAKLIVDGLRKFAREDTPGPLESVRIKHVVDETLVVFAERLKNRGVELRLDIDSHASAECRPHRLTQVLLNLITNAVHAVEGTRAPWLSVSVADKEDEVQVAVTDSGPGVPHENREKVFQPFFTTKPVGKGTGLGLSISKGIIEEFGGQLELDVQSDATRFVITLPKKAQ